MKNIFEQDDIDLQNSYDYDTYDEKDEDGNFTVYDRDNQPHNLNGPAYISKNKMRQEWWQHGKRHRDNGPAIISFVFQMDESYYLFGNRLTKEKYFEIKDDENKKLLWILQQGK